MIRELLKRGHEVDLFSIADFILPGALSAFPKFSYLPVAVPWADVILHKILLRVPRWLGGIPSQLFNPIRHARYYRKIEALVRTRHSDRPYDALLVLDVISPFNPIAGLPIINCPPGSPLGELEGIRNSRAPFLRYSNRWLYYALIAYYQIRVVLARRLQRRCDQLICASRWTASCWQQLGFDSAKIAVVPFCLDFDRFHATTKRRDQDDAAVTFLHLGRIVPRKRLDLLIEAFRLLIEERPGVKLLIVGKFSYATGYRRLLDPSQAPPGVEYLESVPREQVARLFETADVLVQPSENEDFGSAVMEAQGSGVPVVVGPSNGTAEYVGKQSFVFKEYTAESLRDALRAAVDAVRADQVGLAEDSRRAAEMHFRAEDVAEQVLAVVREVAERMVLARSQPSASLT
jgi:glycosyltransferase involved in cell wall biosynthesis